MVLVMVKELHNEFYECLRFYLLCLYLSLIFCLLIKLDAVSGGLSLWFSATKSIAYGVSPHSLHHLY